MEADFRPSPICMIETFVSRIIVYIPKIYIILYDPNPVPRDELCRGVRHSQNFRGQPLATPSGRGFWWRFLLLIVESCSHEVFLRCMICHKLGKTPIPHVCANTYNHYLSI